jgi:hypothetical protein
VKFWGIPLTSDFRQRTVSPIRVSRHPQVRHNYTLRFEEKVDMRFKCALVVAVTVVGVELGASGAYAQAPPSLVAIFQPQPNFYIGQQTQYQVGLSITPSGVVNWAPGDFIIVTVTRNPGNGVGGGQFGQSGPTAVAAPQVPNGPTIRPKRNSYSYK